MDQYFPLLTGLAGALIGGVSAIAAIFIQAHYQNKRDRVRLCMEMALEDFKLNREAGMQHVGTFEERPLAVFFHYHIELLNLIEQNRLTPESHSALTEATEKWIAALKSQKPIGVVVRK